MAARIEAHPPANAAQIVDLRHIDTRRMELLLREETAAWSASLEWDFQKSADLVRRFVDLHALNGCALLEGGAVIGYAYYVLEEQKGLVGDLFVRERSRTVEKENALLEWTLDAIAAVPSVRRIESQLMMIDSRAERPLPYGACLHRFERNFMKLPLARAGLAPGRIRKAVLLERWSDHYQDAAAQVIAAAYHGHVDSSINDQYRTIGGARRFLYNIVQYPGCGSFYRPASWAALDAATGRLCGISLASMVAEACGHITQICVAPSHRGKGVGYALLRQSLTTLREAGCRSASLTVTQSNAGAVALYEQLGFVTARRFSAYVWEGW